MAFSLRRMLSNISYFTKSGDDENEVPDDVTINRRRHKTYTCSEETSILTLESTEPDSTSKQCSSLILPESVKSFTAKKGSLSDTDLVTVNIGQSKKRKSKKLKLDIKKASQSMMESLNRSDNDDSSNCIENTPKHILLECKSADVFSERLKKFNFDTSFDISDYTSNASSYGEENLEIDSLSDHSETDLSDEGTTVKMCRKVEPENGSLPTVTPESFEDVEDNNEEERITLLLNYQMKLEKFECILKKLLKEFQFHIEVSKIFNSKSIVTALPGSDVKNISRILGEITHIDNVTRGVSPSWNIVMEKEDSTSKHKLKKQLLAMKEHIENFVNTHLQNHNEKSVKSLSRYHRSITFDLHKGKRMHKQNKMSNKKKIKHFDFPDLREVMINLFSTESDKEDYSISGNNITQLLSDSEEYDIPKCDCKCHCSSQTDSGLTTKMDQTDQSITSSIGNFTLDSTTLSAYSESLDLVISYNSFQDTSLFCTLLQKAAIERITFYVQVHSIQMKCETTQQDFESKNVIKFYCPSCSIMEDDENGLLKHILSQKHCEEIHFQYKTAYIKKCVSSGKEIMPSTVLNPMKMYRDDNKIVCFGDAMYACSLCFENLIIGESILMAHCGEAEHVSRRERLSDILE